MTAGWVFLFAIAAWQLWALIGPLLGAPEN